ncbi:unnamed protein product [Vitrella brassicaformis CCMP3155]|uniref:UMP-CMP kinase n=2 Tax=Vitrella brassicaformis TaxID=1169539 RepID=A0A0G4EKT6_VITBC|nr:unnamed protein product [Vitrella brassicaformis CCMP3155]|mmetsp:Transcript_24523/g.60606  ORF Transcript_24523/g.60606 Transcript_24523/m.60606 type:complete len:208 (+) Transcript_24523:302-925(+)|eukprot:CEL97781.1 unnamed protein product [Vitrella brassicaformis CCMP3155]
MARPIVVFVLGGPGAGKGTQCTKIEETYGFCHVSAGDCLREERKTPGSEFGELIETYIKEGKIVPVEITVKLLEKKMRSHGWEGGKFLIDGFPRNLNNFEGWYAHLKDAVDDRYCLFFDCPEDVMEQRLVERGKDSGRVDDNLDSIRKRFKTYVDETMPIIQCFNDAGKLKKVDANQDICKVWEEVRCIFDDICQPKLLNGCCARSN